MNKGMTRKSMDYAKGFIEWVNGSPTPFHAVENVKKMLKEAGFKELKEREEEKGEGKEGWKEGGKYFITRNQSSIVLWTRGKRWKGGEEGVAIIGAHTDSPCLKVKPISLMENVGYRQIGVETYGGGLWHTWFDRDLSLAGRVLVREKTHSSGTQEVIVQRLVKINRPILRIPTLAIHLDRNVNTEGFKFNNETHLVPMLSTLLQEQLNEKEVKNEEKEKEKEKGVHLTHPPRLMTLIAEELKCSVEDIVDFELSLYDTQAACLGGIYEEFVYSARLDNLMMSYCAVMALLESLKEWKMEEDVTCRMIALFDHEEVGSESAFGAGSPLLDDLLRRMMPGEMGQSSLERTLQKSFLISADMAHAIHPNYKEKHEDRHRPQLHQGVVIKYNSNQRYATTAATRTIVKEIARLHSIPIQEFVVRNDSTCGSTIGPILSTHTGIRTVDVGNPQLSMHSIREVCGVEDIGHAIKLFTVFFKQERSSTS